MKINVLMKKLIGVLLIVILLCQMAVPAFAGDHDTAGSNNPVHMAHTVTTASTAPASTAPTSTAPASISPTVAAVAASQPAPFPDMVSEDSWSYKALTAAVDAGLLKGSNGMLKPYGNMTRAEMATIVLRALGLEDTQGRDLTPFKADIDSYKDVDKSDWYFDEIAMAYKLKLFNGISGSQMSPDGKVSREQAFTVLCRLMGLDETIADMSALNKFIDAGNLSAWAKPYVAVMAPKGYISGSGSALHPKSPITRQEFAQLIYNLFESNYISGQKTADILSGKTVTGNMIISACGITLSNLTVNGDVIVGDGVGSGSVTLDGVTISGRLIVRGGGENTIYLKNTTANTVVVEKLSDGGVRIYGDDGSAVEYMEIADGNDMIVIECDVAGLSIFGSSLHVVVNCEVQDITVSGDNNTLSGNGSIGNITVEGGVSSVTVLAQCESVGNNTGKAVTLIGKDGKGITVAAGATVSIEGDPDSNATSYTVTFHSNGGGSFSPRYVSAGGALGGLPLSYKENMIFLGWFTDDGTFANAVTEGTPIYSDMDLYACYLPADPIAQSNEQTMTSVADVAPDYSVTVLSSTPMSAEAVKNAITIELLNEDEEEFGGLSVNSGGGGGGFAVSAAEGFTPGSSYTLTLTDNALTFDGHGSKVRKYNITIADPEPVLNLRLNDSVKAIPAGEISGVTQNGEAVDSIFAPLFEVDEEAEEDDGTLTGTFIYSGGIEIYIGDALAIYEGTAPGERMAGVDYSGQNIAYVTVTGVSGSTISYTKAEAADVLFTPEIFPINIADDEDGDPDNSSVTIEIGKITDIDELFTQLGYDLGIDSSTVVEAGDFLAFYEEPLDAGALIGYARITEVMTGGVYYVITYETVTIDELLGSMDIAASQELTYDQLAENADMEQLQGQLRQQVTESGFIDAASEFLVKLANTDEDTREQVIDELGIKDFRMTRMDSPVLIASSRNVMPDFSLLMAGMGGPVMLAASQNVDVDFSFSISPNLDHYAGQQGLKCDITVTCNISLGDNVSITVTGTFTQEIKIELDITGEATLAWALFIPIPIDFTADASVSIYSYTSLALNALLTTSSGKKDLDIRQKIAELDYTGTGALPPEEKSKTVREFYEIYQEMLAQEHDYFELFKIPIVSFKGGVDPLHIIGFGVSVDFVVSADANVSLGIEFGYEKATRYSVHLESGSKRAETKQTELVDGDYSFIVYVMGTLGLRAGIKATVEIGFIDVDLDSIGFSVELGAYWRMWGFVYYELVHENNVTTSHYGGGVYMELGIYLEIDFIAQVFNNEFEYVVTLYENEWPLLKIGDRYYVFDFEYVLDADTDDIDLNNINTFTLPDTFRKMYQMDYKTGSISVQTFLPGEFTYTVEEDNYHAFSVGAQNNISVHPPAGVTSASAKLVVSWNKNPLSFTSSPMSRTFVLNWSGPATGSYCYYFETNGGNYINSKRIGYGYKLQVLPTPWRIGYTFTGWFTNSDFTSALGPDEIPDADITLYARWQPNYVDYTVRHYEEQLDGTYRLYSAVTEHGWADQNITAPVWNLDGYISPQAQTVTVAPDNSTAVEYYYGLEDYTYTFKPNNGGDNIIVTAKYGSRIHAPSLVKPGYAFMGWDPAVPLYLHDDDVTYEAQWARNEYAIAYGLAGGSVTGQNPATFNIESAGITLINPTRTGGYVFAGWTGTGLSAPAMTVTIPQGSTGNRYYTATWTTFHRYDIRHIRENLNGVYSLMELEFGAGGAGLETNAQPKTYEGFTLREPVAQQIISAQNDTVVSIYYSRNSYTATFGANGGEGGGAQSVKYGGSIYAAYVSTVSVSREGYVLTGWSPAISAGSTMPAHDVTYTAQWTPSDYTITYNLAGGSVAGTNPGGYNANSEAITLTNPTKQGYIFAGWTGTELSEPTLSVTIPTGSTGNRQYTANWTEDDDYHTLTFDANGGQGGVTLRVMPGETITPPIVTRTLYIFNSWSPEVPDIMPDSDLTLIANWDPICNVFKFDMNGVDVWAIPEDVYCWSDSPGQLPNRVGAVYDPEDPDSDVNLAGWSTSKDGTTGKTFGRGDFVYALTPFDGAEVTMYAQWKPRNAFGVFDAMYMIPGQAFGLDENGTVTDEVYDASVSGEKPVLAYPVSSAPFMYFRVKKTGDSDNPIALYLYKCDGIYDPVDDFSGYPLVPYDPENSDDPYGAPEGSLIGSGNNDGLTPLCKSLLQNKYGIDWAKGLVTVGNIIMLWEDSRDGYDNVGFVFESVNGVRYFIGGRESYSYGMEYQYEILDFGYTVTDPDPTMTEVDEINCYKSGPISSFG